MTTLEEMVETFTNAIDGEVNKEIEEGSHRGMSLHDLRRIGLRAVLEKHVGPMIAQAHADGSSPYSGKAEVFLTDEDYAARIIAQLTKQNERMG